MKTGFSLCTFPNREKPVFITWEPCNETRVFPAWEKYTGKTLFWPYTGLQWNQNSALADWKIFEPRLNAKAEHWNFLYLLSISFNWKHLNQSYILDQWWQRVVRGLIEKAQNKAQIYIPAFFIDDWFDLWANASGHPHNGFKYFLK